MLATRRVSLRLFHSTPSFLQSRKPSPMSEVVAAANAAAAAPSPAPTIFDLIVAGKIPCNKVHEDEHVLAFRDIAPQAPVHVVVIPKVSDGLTQLSNARLDQEAILGKLMYRAGQIGKKECPGGFRIVVNDGKDGAQSVYHIHLHVLGGRQMEWPPG